jgi:hypothetical protein
MSSNSIWNQTEKQIKLRGAQDAVQLGGRVVLAGKTTNATQTQIYLRYAQTGGLDVNSEAYYTTNGTLEVEPGTVALIKGVCLALRTDTVAVHHLSHFELAVFRPLTGNMVVTGEYGTTDYTAATPAIAGANPAYQLINGTQADLSIVVNTNGTINFLVTGEANQTINWEIVLDYVRSISVAV